MTTVEERTCVVCGRPLPAGSRVDRTTCSDACRQRARYRRAADRSLTDADSGGANLTASRGSTDVDFWGAKEALEERDRLLRTIWPHQAHQCVWCGGSLQREQASPHHLIPRGWTGSSDYSHNLVIVHLAGCHDEIDLWTSDHGRPPNPMELREHQRTGVIREPVAHYSPRIESMPANPLRELLEQANAQPEGVATIEVRLAWSPVAHVIARRFAHPQIRFTVADPRLGDTAEAFWRRHGLKGMTFDDADPASRPAADDLAGSGELASRDARLSTAAPDGVAVPRGPAADLPPSVAGHLPNDTGPTLGL